MEGVIAGHVVEGPLCRADFLLFLEEAVVSIIHFFVLLYEANNSI